MPNRNASSRGGRGSATGGNRPVGLSRGGRGPRSVFGKAMRGVSEAAEALLGMGSFGGEGDLDAEVRGQGRGSDAGASALLISCSCT